MKIIQFAFLILNAVFNCNGFKENIGFDSRSYEMPKTCEGLRFCAERGDYYPKQVVDLALWKILTLKRGIKEVKDSFETRLKDSPLDPECETNEIKFKPLYYILDQKDQPRVVIQSEKFKFVQKYEIRWCQQEGPANNTLHFKHTALSKVVMTCNNVKTALDLYVLTEDKLSMEMISVKMPVFCKARYDLK